jgi:predicted RNA binding protein YcfA (HicA-like mRNA interferase family)
MPRLGPIKRIDLVNNLKRLGFEGPFPGGKHEYLVKGTIKVRIPNPHEDIGKELLVRILKQAQVERKEWEKLK